MMLGDTRNICEENKGKSGKKLHQKVLAITKVTKRKERKT